MQRRLTDDETAVLAAEYQAGNSMGELAKRWRLHRSTVAAQLRRTGVELRRQGVPNDKLTEAVQLYFDGWSCRRLGERYGCDAEAVRRTLLREGVRMRKPWER